MHGDTSTKASALASYLISSVLFFFADALQFLDNHAPAVGAMAAIATVIINWYYSRRSALRRHHE